MIINMQTSLTDKAVNSLGNTWQHCARTFLVLCVLISCQSCWANIAIIVHPSNNSYFSKNKIRQIFLGKIQVFSDGQRAIVYELDDSQKQSQTLFYSKLIEKNQSTLQAYWARMLFSSKANPPIKIASHTEMKHAVANTLLAIGYIDSQYLDSSVKSVLIIKN